MNLFRWVAYCPVSIAVFIGCLYFVPFILGWIYKIMYFIIFFGTKYDMPPLFEFEYNIQDFKFFIFTTCFGTIISGFVAGALAGYIAPKSSRPGIATVVFAIPLTGLLTRIGIIGWNTEHWFYSSCIEVTLLITALAGIIGMYHYNSEQD